MQVVLWDIIRAEAYTTAYIKTNVTRNAVEENAKLQQQIFAMHQVSKDEFYQSFSYYKTHTGLMKPILDSMINKASREPSYNFKPVPQTEK